MFKLFLSISVLACSLLSAEVKVLAISGSLREDSYNKKLINEAAHLARQGGAAVTVIDLRDFEMPFYDSDIETKGMPDGAKRLRKLLNESQAVIIASPEYNGSLSAVLKNAIDWSSRTEKGEPSKEAFNGKKIAIMSASMGAGGGGRGLVHLRTILENLGAKVVPIQLTVGSANQTFNTEGRLTDTGLQNLLKMEIQQLLENGSQHSNQTVR